MKSQKGKLRKQSHSSRNKKNKIVRNKLPKETKVLYTENCKTLMMLKRCSTSLIIREMQIKATLRYHFMPVRMLLSKSLHAINAGEGVEKREPSYTVGGNAN